MLNGDDDVSCRPQLARTTYTAFRTLLLYPPKRLQQHSTARHFTNCCALSKRVWKPSLTASIGIRLCVLTWLRFFRWKIHNVRNSHVTFNSKHTRAHVHSTRKFTNDWIRFNSSFFLSFFPSLCSSFFFYTKLLISDGTFLHTKTYAHREWKHFLFGALSLYLGAMSTQLSRSGERRKIVFHQSSERERGVGGEFVCGENELMCRH